MPTAKQFMRDAFTRATLGIIAQGGPSLAHNGTCAYRGPKGRKCAVGFLIPDDRYQPAMEGRGCADVCEAAGILAGLPMASLDTVRGFLLDMQSAHDRAADECDPADASDDVPQAFWDAWRANLADVLRTYKLNAAAVLRKIPKAA